MRRNKQTDHRLSSYNMFQCIDRRINLFLYCTSLLKHCENRKIYIIIITIIIVIIIISRQRLACVQVRAQRYIYLSTFIPDFVFKIPRMKHNYQ